MRAIATRLRLLTLVPVMAILMVVALGSLTIFGDIKASAQATNLASEQLDGWRYNASSTNNAIEVVVRYDVSAQGIRKFDAANRQLVSQVSGPVSATVVFRQPLAVAEFKDLMQKSGVQVSGYTLRAMDSRGIRTTIQGAPRDKELVPQAMLDATLAQTGKQAPGLALKGVITVDVTASRTQLEQLLRDQRVFTTDVTQAIAGDRVRTKVGTTNKVLAQQPIRGHVVGPLYWFMENAGIAPK